MAPKLRKGTYEGRKAPSLVRGAPRHLRETSEQFGPEALPPRVEAEGAGPEGPTDHVILQIQASITAKRDWRGKLHSTDIVRRWCAEARMQGAPEAAFYRAVRELASDRYYEQSGIAYQDHLLPDELLARLTQQLDRVAASSQDFHPDSGDTVRNLIHPSLYPYVYGESSPWDVEPPEYKNVRGGADSIPTDRGEVSKSNRFGHCLVGVEEWSRYQWLPAEVDVDEQGNARWASYVNNAPQEPALLAALEQALSRMLPLFERVVTPPGMRRLASLRGRRLQVVVKAATYELKPGQSYEGGWHVEGMLHERIVAAGIAYYGASENVCGEGLEFRRLRNRNVAGRARIPEYIIGVDSEHEGSNVEVMTSDAPWKSTKGTDTPEMGQDEKASRSTEQQQRPPEEEPDDEELESEEPDQVPTGFMKPKFQLSGEDVRTGSLWSISYKSEEMPNYVDLGTVGTPAGRVLAFKNSLQHRVRVLTNSSATETAVRKVLVFWLVDPDRRVLSSADVPRQQWDNQRVLLAQTLRRQWRFQGRPALPVATVKMIATFAKQGFTRAEALQHRLRLMEERKYSRQAVRKTFNALIRREYSFCEH